MERGYHQGVSTPSARQRWWTMLTMTAKKDAGGEETEVFPWMSDNKVSEFEL